MEKTHTTYCIVPSRRHEEHGFDRVWGVYVAGRTHPVATRIVRDEAEIKAWWEENRVFFEDFR